MRNRRDMPKHQAQYRHFKRRLAERYGITIDRRQYHTLCKRVLKKPSRFLERQSNRVSVHLMQIEHVEVVIVYDSLRQTLVTALPPATDSVAAEGAQQCRH